MLTVITHSPEETWELARKLAPMLTKGDFISLSGDLGAGKTVFAKGLAVGLGIDEPVTSPTFTIIKEYEGKLPLFHFDVYRLASAEELEELGADEYFYGEGVSVVEWGDRVEEILPEERLSIRILRPVDEDLRQIEVTPHGERWKKQVDKWLDGADRVDS
ncbi:MAG: tRNA (adenosine(37)-N6)-threonylcarbamoyltransferase complex ATPase subunit type 1 TsaE [Candidatus Aquicultor primus]|uniref:tRNA threonylcarbamoyladenosine biosynthesis protein TsaE n=1 Tax=Candidatus Aquicultor primus TaxID=1797195 RepID=A0A1F2UL39_9ACTN|nr:MAG: tRNA (adenosine(37)-N6)-threonylcarbamoyltransferase complex ATPase subunit type 1 TsaE [Candidatus Aquicultor primus]HCG98807.1 tRNA (adenosine(37)-N6)-threonylcarbamoyltransferase complex ATPase subunit type 1 TsaE [Actinomycetota bacterium]